MGNTSNKKQSDSFLSMAYDYLQLNTELRNALEIPNDSVLEPCNLGQGEHNKNFYFTDKASGRKFVLRINVISQSFHKNQVAYEFGALQELESSNCTPKPLYCDNSKSFIPYGVMIISFCEGVELDFDNLQPNDLHCAVQLMANVHAVKVTENTSLFRPKDPLGELFKECIKRFRFYYSSAFEDSRITKWVERFISVTQSMLDNTTPNTYDCRHIINTETLPSHFLVPSPASSKASNSASDKANSPNKNKLNARRDYERCSNPGYFIDWERPIIGEVAQDLAYFVAPTTTFWDSNYLFPQSQIEKVIDDYWKAVDGRFEQGNFQRRFKAFQIMTILRSTTWCCKALVQYGTKGEHKTDKTAEKLPIYLSDEFMEYLATEYFRSLF